MASVAALRRTRVFLGAPAWVAIALILLWNLVRWLAPPSELSGAIQSILLAMMLVAMTWFILAFIGLFIFRVRCPRCRELFFEGNSAPYLLKAPASILFMSKCRHCGLSIGSVAEAPPNNSLDGARGGQ